MLPALFANYSNVLFWKVDFYVSTVDTLNQVNTGMGSLTLLVNNLPYGGYCYVDKYNGTSLSTLFNVKCVNWLDKDGFVAHYEYFGN